MSEPAICDPDFDAEFPVIRLGSPADLVDAVPYLLGFHPTDSIVLIAVRGSKRRVGLTLRLDLPALAADPDVIGNCIRHLGNAGAEGVLIAVYSPEVPEPTGTLPHADAVADMLLAARAANADGGEGDIQLPESSIASVGT